jgi:hypothetical protein
MKMIDEKFTDINGRKWRLHTVRSTEANRGFGCIDRRLNAFVATGNLVASSRAASGTN